MVGTERNGRASHDGHLSDEEVVAKMEHPDFCYGLDLGHPPSTSSASSSELVDSQRSVLSRISSDLVEKPPRRWSSAQSDAGKPMCGQYLIFGRYLVASAGFVASDSSRSR
jgi:hypothetical protein